MKPRIRIRAVAALAGLLLTFTGLAVGPAGAAQAAINESCPAVAPQTVMPLYRLFQPNVGDHFYTTSWVECRGALSAGYQYEGLAGHVYSTDAVAAGRVPLYRLFSSGSGDHFYTTDISEVDNAIRYAGYSWEGVAAQVLPTNAAAGIPLYRLFNSGNGDHFYTTNVWEAFNATTAGYTWEGVCCRILP